MQKPEISVIIPAYNIGSYIGKCLDSVLAQDIFDQGYMEIIVVDDGSSDETPAVLDSYAKEHEQIHVIHKKNAGVSAARNDGMEIAQGKYIFFFDGDDFEESYTCREISELADQYDADAVIYGYYRYEDGKIRESCLPAFDQKVYEGEDIAEKVLPAFVGLCDADINHWIAGEKRALYVENPALWRIMLRRDVILKNHLRFDTTLKVGEDTVFITDYLSCASKCVVQQKCYYYLVTRESSAIFQYEKKPMQKLQGKKALMDAREALTARVMERCGRDITAAWEGTTVMSAVEMAFLLSKKSPQLTGRERYKAYRSYVDDPRVIKMVTEFTPGAGSGVKRIPFLLMKKKMFGLLFAATAFLHVIGYEFKR